MTVGKAVRFWKMMWLYWRGSNESMSILIFTFCLIQHPLFPSPPSSLPQTLTKNIKLTWFFPRFVSLSPSLLLQWKVRKSNYIAFSNHIRHLYRNDDRKTSYHWSQWLRKFIRKPESYKCPFYQNSLKIMAFYCIEEKLTFVRTISTIPCFLPFVPFRMIPQWLFGK